MNIIKKLALATAGVATLLTPLGLNTVAHAQAALDIQSLKCRHNSDGIYYSPQGCDLAVDKQVSINGGSFLDADSSADAAQAHVGDTVTWKITVSNPNQESLGEPFGLVRVSDILPTAGVSYDGSSYTASTGTYSGDVWQFALFDTSNSDNPHTNLPATLSIVTHSTATGLFKNTATLTDYNPCTDETNCGWQGAYGDADSSNDSNDAWIDPSGKPAVLADSTTNTSGTLANTGDSTVAISAAGCLIVIMALIVNFLNRKQAYKLNR